MVRALPIRSVTRMVHQTVPSFWLVRTRSVVAQEPPAMGGDHPFRLSSGHGRWSNHAMNMTNPVMLETRASRERPREGGYLAVTGPSSDRRAKDGSFRSRSQSRWFFRRGSKRPS